MELINDRYLKSIDCVNSLSIYLPAKKDKYIRICEKNNGLLTIERHCEQFSKPFPI